MFLTFIFMCVINDDDDDDNYCLCRQITAVAVRSVTEPSWSSRMAHRRPTKKYSRSTTHPTMRYGNTHCSSHLAVKTLFFFRLSWVWILSICAQTSCFSHHDSDHYCNEHSTFARLISIDFYYFGLFYSFRIVSQWSHSWSLCELCFRRCVVNNCQCWQYKKN